MTSAQLTTPLAGYQKLLGWLPSTYLEALNERVGLRAWIGDAPQVKNNGKLIETDMDEIVKWEC